MIRRILKGKEVGRITSADITNMAVGDVLSVYVCSPIQNGDYLLGYNGTSLDCKSFGTEIETQEAENTYLESKLLTNNNLVFNIRKFDDGLTFSREIKTLITEIPQIRVHRVVMLCNGYYLGVNGSSYVTTNNETTAKTDSKYWWDFIGSNANATDVGLYNPSSGRYADYRGRAPETSRSSFSTHFQSNKFSFGGKANGNTQMLNISTNGTVGNISGKMSSTHNWELFSLDVSPTTQGAVTWMYPMPYTINTFTPSSTATFLAGYNGDIFRMNQESSYLRHGNNASAGLSASTTGTDINAAWILYKTTEQTI